MFYIGCPAWGYKEWIGHDGFFPLKTQASEFLRLYSRKLNVVEGNTVFYALPSVETIARWRAETPETFRLCPKVLRSISHELHIETRKNDTLAFVERMRGLDTRLGPIFLQLPPAFGPNQLPQLEAFLAFWPSDIRLAVEVRHPDFYSEAHAAQLNTLISRYNVGRVLMDTRPIRTGSAEEQALLQARERKPNLPLQVTVTTDFAFVRYIGHPRMEVNEMFLDEWAQQIGQWLKQNITVYAFCHCPYEVHSPNICANLYQRVGKIVSLPTLPWLQGKDDTDVKQERLF